MKGHLAFNPFAHGGGKYGARAVHLDGYRFASRKEAARYGTLKAIAQAGQLTDLTVHPRFDFIVNGQRVGRYTADFAYLDQHGRYVVEDVKSEPTRTEAYRLRKRLLKALYDLDVQEV